MRAKQQGATATEEPAAPSARSDLLGRAELPTHDARIALASGRRYRLASRNDGVDSILVTAADGAVVLSIEVTDRGPVLAFHAAEVQLCAARTIRLEADQLELRSRGDVRIDAAGSLREDVGGDHHLRVAGDDRIEARAMELQASSGHVGVRAMRGIALDGEHIGLNDDPVPRPYPWSAIAAAYEAK